MAEGGHDVGLLLGQGGGYAVDELAGRRLVHGAVLIAQPDPPVRLAAERSPRGLILGTPDRTERVPGRRELVAHVSVVAVSRQDQHEPELRVIRTQRDRASDPVHVVIGMSEDTEQRSWHPHIVTGTAAAYKRTGYNRYPE